MRKRACSAALGNFGGYVSATPQRGQRRPVGSPGGRHRGRAGCAARSTCSLDIVIDDDLRTVLWPPPSGDDDETWAIRASMWDDDDVLMAGSDAGAHLDRMCGGSYPTQFLADCLRGRKFMPIEQAIHNFTDKPARLFGLRDRGRITEGRVRRSRPVRSGDRRGAAGPARARPARGAVRLVAGSIGVHRVFVNGVETIRDGESTGATPGTVLRSGRDTDTVTARPSYTVEASGQRVVASA